MADVVLGREIYSPRDAILPAGCVCFFNDGDDQDAGALCKQRREKNLHAIGPERERNLLPLVLAGRRFSDVRGGLLVVSGRLFARTLVSQCRHVLE